MVVNHWDRLETCIVGRAYRPEFYTFVKDTQVRRSIEQIAKETNEDLDNLSTQLQKYQVEVLRPEVSDDYRRYSVGNKILPAPLTPRDYTAVIDNVMFMPEPNRASKWYQIRGENWQEDLPESWDALSRLEREDLATMFNITSYEDLIDYDFSSLHSIQHWAIASGMKTIYNADIDSAMVLRLGNRLVVGNWYKGDQRKHVMQQLHELFPNKTIDLVETEGHLDGTFTVPAEGLIVASNDLPDRVYQQLFPDWEVVRLKKSIPRDFRQQKQQQSNAWYVPAQLDSPEFGNYVEQYLSNWVGDIRETTANVNMLMVAPDRAFCAEEDTVLFRALERYGVVPELVPFRHYSFWDSGLHCVTSDVERSNSGT